MKSELLFQQLNPPGQSQHGVSASDKDWEVVFDNLVYIATYWTQEQFKECFNSTTGHKLPELLNKHKYKEELTKRAIKAFRLSEEEDDHKYIGFIMLLFGNEAKLNLAEYTHEICDKKCNWIFNANEVRTRLEPFLDEEWLLVWEDSQ